MKRFSKSKLIKAMGALKKAMDKYQNSLEKWCLRDWHPILIEELFMEVDMKSALINVVELVNKMDLDSERIEESDFSYISKEWNRVDRKQIQEIISLLGQEIEEQKVPLSELRSKVFEIINTKKHRIDLMKKIKEIIGEDMRKMFLKR